MFIPEVEDVAFGVAGVMVMQVGVGERTPSLVPVVAPFVFMSGHLLRG